MTKPRILLLSAYDASSHRYWRELLTHQLTEFDWTVATLPDRHFYWRVRSNAMTYALLHRDTLQSDYDLILATSMVDLCGLRGLLPSISHIPTVLYFHENQFAYPARKPSSNIINAQLVSIYSALCADRVLFNSHYNRQTFLAGANTLLTKMPDGVPRDAMADVDRLSEVLPVPIHAPATAVSATTRDSGKGLEIVWNHRWEYDKQPEVFFAAMHLLQQAGVHFVLHVMGQSFRESPPCFAEARESLKEHIVTWGYQPKDRYEEILRQANVVVSSAAHDFQGLGMLEAISHGCVPVAPARVAYTEYVPESLLYHCDAGDSSEAALLFEKLAALSKAERPVAPDVTKYYADNLLDQYRELLADAITARCG